MKKDGFWLLIVIAMLIIWTCFGIYKSVTVDASPGSKSWSNGVHAACIGSDKIYKFGDDIEVVPNHKECQS